MSRSPTSRRRRATSWVAGMTVALALIGCVTSPPEPPDVRWPILLITFSGLRAEVGGKDWARAPELRSLASLAEGADWSGTVWSTGSWSVPAIGSLLTGEPPSVHGATDPGHPALRPEVPVLAERLRASGYRTAARVSNPWLVAGSGFSQGFDTWERLERPRQALQDVDALAPGTFLWLQLREPHLPYRFDERLGDRAPQLDPGSPRALGIAERRRLLTLEQAPAAQRLRQLEGLYRHSVATADLLAGRILQRLRASENWDRTLIVVTSDCGAPLGDEGAFVEGQALLPSALRVPLIVKLPHDLGGELAPLAAPAGLGDLHDLVLAVAAGETPTERRRSPIAELWLSPDGFHEIAVAEGGVLLRRRIEQHPTPPTGMAAEAMLWGGGGAYRDWLQRVGRPSLDLLAAEQPPVDSIWSSGEVEVSPAGIERLRRQMEVTWLLPDAPLRTPQWRAPPRWPQRQLRSLLRWGLPVPGLEATGEGTRPPEPAP